MTINLPPDLPSIANRKKQEMLDLLLEEEYGCLPPRPYLVSAETVKTDKKFCAGKAFLEKVMLNCKADFGEFSFPVYLVIPRNADKIPAFIHINFRDLVPDKYQPTEELIDAGFATLTFCYTDVSSDDGDFTNGLAGVVYPDGVRKRDDCGKIGLWAWAAMAVMDYALTIPELDKERISVAGHSRLGKTALLVGALDERFDCAFSNDSGCSGAGLSRGSEKETVQKITAKFPFWFCENYKKYADREDLLPFDQHFLIAANYPHKVYVASAAEDPYACTKSEYRAAVAASGFFEERGVLGFVHPDRLPLIGENFHNGNIGYHLRAGNHYFSREDWLRYIAFLNAKHKAT